MTRRPEAPTILPVTWLGYYAARLQAAWRARQRRLTAARYQTTIDALTTPSALLAARSEGADDDDLDFDLLLDVSRTMLEALHARDTRTVHACMITMRAVIVHRTMPPQTNHYGSGS